VKSPKFIPERVRLRPEVGGTLMVETAESTGESNENSDTAVPLIPEIVTLTAGFED
jgi:hypothetical protein